VVTKQGEERRGEEEHSRKGLDAKSQKGRHGKSQKEGFVNFKRLSISLTENYFRLDHLEAN